MAARVRPIWLASLLALAGCVDKDSNLPLVSSSPFTPAAEVKAGAPVPHVAASEAVALRVSLLGQKILTANRQSGLAPTFHAIGVPAPEVFHRGDSELYVTEGLARLCKTDAQLAAVLALEMGKMVAQREARATPATRRGDQLPPEEARIGTDAGGTFGPADGTHLFELAKFEKQRPRVRTPLPLPEPAALARGYLEKAGYSGKDLDAAAPILKAARANLALEKQLVTSPPSVPARAP